MLILLTEIDAVQTFANDSFHRLESVERTIQAPITRVCSEEKGIKHRWTGWTG